MASLELYIHFTFTLDLLHPCPDLFPLAFAGGTKCCVATGVDCNDLPLTEDSNSCCTGTSSDDYVVAVLGVAYTECPSNIINSGGKCISVGEDLPIIKALIMWGIVPWGNFKVLLWHYPLPLEQAQTPWDFPWDFPPCVTWALKTQMRSKFFPRNSFCCLKVQNYVSQDGDKP
jgi:hypothetical protein